MALDYSSYLQQPSVPFILILAVTSCVLLLLLSVRFRKGLRDIPGPFLASISPLDRILTAYSGQQFAKHMAYHERYGPVVRIGPNHVSVADSDQISVIYHITSKFNKVCHGPNMFNLFNLPCDHDIP